ncbi:iron ABC transporter permease, partial [Burkholderia multivorans]
MTTDRSFSAPRGRSGRPPLRLRARGVWTFAALAIAAAVAAPLAALVAAAFDADFAHWRHLAAFVLPQ